MTRKWISLLITILIAVLLAVIATKPPGPKGDQISADMFSSGRAMADVRVIAAKPHPTGSAENAKVRSYLRDRMEAMGLEVVVSQSKLQPRSLKRLNQWSGENKTEQDIFNVIGTLRGKDSSKPAILLMAHHDTVWGSPGAADDTIGIAAIFEIVRALKIQGNYERDLIVLLTDGEELGLSGAVNFFSDNPMSNRVGAIINFEARGGGGTANMFQTSAGNGNAMRLFARSVKRPSASSLSTFVYSVLPNDTDLTPALKKDYVAYNIANIGRAEYYHSPKITPNALEQATLQHMGSQGLDLTRALLSVQALPEKRADATFFDVFGFFTLIYSPFWGWVFLALALVLGMLSLERTEARTDLGRKTDLAKGAVRMMLFLGIGAVLLYGLNWVSGAGRAADYYDRLAAISKLEVMAAFLCFGMIVLIFGRRTLSSNEKLGAALPIFILAIAGQALAPTATYFMSIPIMIFCAVIWLSKQRFGGKLTGVMTIILAAVVAGYMLGLGHLLMLGIGPDMPSAVILPAAIFALILLPNFPAISRRSASLMLSIGFGLSLVMALWIRLDPIAATIPVY